MARITDPSFQFWYEEKWYTVQGAETMISIGTKDDMSTMRSEYTRMRDAAQKRVARLQKMYPDSVGAKRRYDTGKTDKEGNPIYKSGFPTLRSLNPKDFAKAFADVAKFLRAKGSTVTGQKQIKEKTIQTWQAQGLNLNAKNYDRTIKILEQLRRMKIVYGSDDVVDVADAMLELDDQQFNDWLDHIDTLLQHQQELDLWQDVMESRGEAVDIDEIIRELGW